jgi:hypothetical protein
MRDYLKRVWIYRLSFFGLVLLCYFLEKNNLTDYMIVITVTVSFLGIFTLSHVQVTSHEVRIRKHYFWGLIGMKRVLNFNQITALKTKEYEIDVLEDSWMFTENLFAFLALDILRPKTRWLTTKLCYLDDGSVKDIELKISREDYREIDRRKKPDRGLYKEFY